MRLLLRTALNPHSGYGNDGLALASALTQAGIDVYLDPLSVSTPLPALVAELLTKRLQPPFDLLLHHADPAALGITDGTRRASTLTAAWTMWEYTTLDNLRGRTTLRKRLANYDTVIGYDHNTTTALAGYTRAATATVQGGYTPELWPPTPRDWHQPRFAFCMVGALHARKNPMAAITAFKELREEHPQLFAHAELNVKTVSPGLHSAMQTWCPGLRLHYEVWPQATMRAFYTDQHVLLAPSRGEGKNLPALEFLSTGGTVIATNFGGHTQWLTPAIGYPLHHTLTPVSPATPNCLWAEADPRHLKELMLHAITSRDDTQRRGDNAARLIPQMCGWPAVLHRLFTVLAEAHPGHGQRLLHDFHTGLDRQNTGVRRHDLAPALP